MYISHRNQPGRYFSTSAVHQVRRACPVMESLSGAPAARGARVTDPALVNATVLTMDPARPRASSVAIAGGRIEALDAGPARRARPDSWAAGLEK